MDNPETCGRSDREDDFEQQQKISLEVKYSQTYIVRKRTQFTPRTSVKTRTAVAVMKSVGLRKEANQGQKKLLLLQRLLENTKIRGRMMLFFFFFSIGVSMPVALLNLLCVSAFPAAQLHTMLYSC